MTHALRWASTKVREPPNFYRLNDLEEILINYEVCSTTQVFQQRTNTFSNHSHNQIKYQHTDVFTW
jgi:hypothetical protein